MTARISRQKTGFGVCVLGVMALVAFGLSACRKEPAEQPSTPDQNQVGKAGVNPVSPSEPPVRLADIIAGAKTWCPAPSLAVSLGKPAPALSVMDLSGKTHTLADYKGRSVLIVILAPWLGVSKMELPDLADVRKTTPDTQLFMLGLSYITEGRIRNTEDAIRQFVLANPVINFPVAAVKPENLPAPWGQVTDVPCSILIGPDGIIKVATMGPVTPSDFKSLLRAK